MLVAIVPVDCVVRLVVAAWCSESTALVDLSSIARKQRQSDLHSQTPPTHELT